MPKRKNVKANLDRRDSVRVVLTETMPYEVPVIFSNDGFYSNLKNYKNRSPELKDLISKVVLDNVKNYTIPHRYKIKKDAASERQLSLLHPAAQIRVSRFYQKYENLICYYCSISDFSIRYPERVGSSYFYSGTYSERNAYKSGVVDTVDLDKRVRNPASYFSYQRYSRKHKFFSSDDFMRLEKAYSHMSFFDVSNCFGSIYTHTCTWAVKSIDHAKNNTSAHSFGNDFDTLMQKMNYNETNGICIGPEVSRIFAEVIFQSIDSDISLEANKVGLKRGVDFDCRRYVDDYMVFTNGKETSAHVRNIISACLLKYNLHLNQMKTEEYSRPFQTNRSQIIHELDSKLRAFSDLIVHVVDTKPKSLAPKPLYNPKGVVKSFITGIKACCFERSVGYDAVADYVISGLIRLIEEIIDGVELQKSKPREAPDLYATTFLVLLELVYFMYTVHPTVSSSFRVAKATIVCNDFFKVNFPSRCSLLAESLTAWMVQIVNSIRPHQVVEYKQAIPIEIINILLSLSQFDEDQLIEASYLERLFDFGHADYFRLVSCLFYIRKRPRYRKLTTLIEQQLDRLLTGSDVALSAHDAHLMFDVLSCPHLSVDFRSALLLKIYARIGLPIPSTVRSLELVLEVEQNPWFINWEAISLLNMIRKKELSTVY